MFERALLYARTVRHLRWEQWWYRLARGIQTRLPFYPVACATADQDRIRVLAREVSGWGPPRSNFHERADEIVAGTFRFLNHSEALPNIDWRVRYVSHLWSYNLHYFDYATDLAWAFRETSDTRYSARFLELALGWISGTNVGEGDGWEPYAVSLRVVNWVQALLLISPVIDTSSKEQIECSLVHQTAFLARRLELHILANHLQKNLHALVIAGLYFTGPVAEQWIQRGPRMLWRELFEQVLPDGAQFERSPMYHAIALADFLQVIALLRATGLYVPDAAQERVTAMVQAYGVLARPDGRLHLFNDAAEGIAPERTHLTQLAQAAIGHAIPLPAGQLLLPDAGYYGYTDPSSANRLLIDCGEPGPRYQPGHAHCDLLSFELDIAGQPLVVDSGVSGYEGDPFREYVRSTRAHNTIMVAGREQSEVWGTFRMARRARVLRAKCVLERGVFQFEGAYSPYHDSGIVHARVVEGTANSWSVEDRVPGAQGAMIQSFLHLHPG